MEFLSNEVATYLKWLNVGSLSPINIIAPPMNGGGIAWGTTFPPLEDGAVEILHGELLSREDLGAVWASVHYLDDGAVGRQKVAKGDVLAYRFLAIDIDNKPSNGQRCSAMEAELQEVEKVADIVKRDLVERGLSTPLKVCSGNGYLLLFPISLTNTAEHQALMGALADVLAAKYNNAYCEIDTAVVKDPSRVCGLVGTMNRNRPQIADDGRIWRVRTVVGEYPNRAPVSESAFKTFAHAFIAEQGGDAISDASQTVAPLVKNTVVATPIAVAPTIVPSIKDDGADCRQALNRWAVAYLAKCAPANEGQHGDDKTFNTAGHLAAARCHHGIGLSEHGVLMLMEEHYNPKCSPPWESTDLAKKVRSAFSNGTPRACKTVDCTDEVSTVAPSNTNETATVAASTNNDGTNGPFTDDVGNARAFLQRYGQNIIYVPLWKAWLIWDGKRWARDNKDDVKKMAVHFVEHDMMEIFKTIKDGDKQRNYLRWMSQSRASFKVDAMLSVVQKLIGEDPSMFDRDGNLLNVENGTIDLSDGTLRPHRQSDYIIKLARVRFDPTATAPTWLKFIDRIFQDADGKTQLEVIEYIQRAVGYSMTADIVAQCLFVLWGGGRNGKTTFVEAILSMMGEYAIVGQQSLLLADDKFKQNAEDEANLQGVRFASCSEINNGQRFDEAKIKRLVGTSKIRARRLYESSFEFDATHKLWLDCNHKPKVLNNDEGVWRRIKLIPFLQQIPLNERDEKLSEKLRAESSGILNWCLQGLRAWRADGKLHEPRAVSDAVNEYRCESDNFGQFLSDCIEPNDAERTPTDDVYRAYIRWLDYNGLKGTLSKIEFGKRMRERNYPSKPFNGKRCFVGLSVKGDGHADAERLGAVDDGVADERAF